jgi:tetratricopeptide (TPR) repeat protein
MFARAYQVVLLTIGLLVFAGFASAQTGRIGGKVTGKDGQPIKGAVVRAERQEMPGGSKAKTNKRGEYLFGFLQMGVYNLILEVNGEESGRVNNVKPTSRGEPGAANFDLGERAAEQAAANSGTLTEAQLKNMTPAQRKRYEERLGKRRQQISRNKELNDAFNLAMDAMSQKNYPAAIASFKKAGEIDAGQVAIWAQLAKAESSYADTLRGDEAKATRSGAIASYTKALEFKPDDAGYRNNLGLELIKQGDMEAGTAELEKAGMLDPANAGKYYFNLGATLINTGDTAGAANAFRKAAEERPPHPPYAPALYQLGIVLMSSAEVDENGNVKPAEGTVEAFQKYLDVDPTGPYAAQAQSMIATLKGSVDLSFENPDAKKRKRRKR